MIIVSSSQRSSANEFARQSVGGVHPLKGTAEGAAPIDLRGKTVAEVPSVEVIAEGTNTICFNYSVVLSSSDVVVIVTCFAKGLH